MTLSILRVYCIVIGIFWLDIENIWITFHAPAKAQDATSGDDVSCPDVSQADAASGASKLADIPTKSYHSANFATW